MGPNNGSRYGSSSPSIGVVMNEDSYNKDDNGERRRGRENMVRNSQTGVGIGRNQRMSLEKRQRVKMKKDKWARMLKGEGDLPQSDSPTPTVSSSSISTADSSPGHRNHFVVTSINSSTSSINDSNSTMEVDDDDENTYTSDQSPYRQYREEQQQQYQQQQQERFVLSFVEEEEEKENDDNDEEDIGTRLRKRVEESNRLEMMLAGNKGTRTPRNQPHRFDNYYDNEEDENEMQMNIISRSKAKPQSVRGQGRSRSYQPASAYSRSELILPLNKIRLHDSVDYNNRSKTDNKDDKDDFDSEISRSRSMRRARSERAIADKERKNNVLVNTSSSNTTTSDNTANGTPFRVRRARSTSLHNLRRKRGDLNSTNNNNNNNTDDEYDAYDDNDPKENLRVKRHLELRQEGEKQARLEENRRMKEERQARGKQRFEKEKRVLAKKNKLLMEMSAPISTSTFREEQESQRRQQKSTRSLSLDREMIHSPLRKNMRSEERMLQEFGVDSSASFISTKPLIVTPSSVSDPDMPRTMWDAFFSEDASELPFPENEPIAVVSPELDTANSKNLDRKVFESNQSYQWSKVSIRELELEREPGQQSTERKTVSSNMAVTIPPDDNETNDEQQSSNDRNITHQNTGISTSEHECESKRENEILLRRSESYMSASSASLSPPKKRRQKTALSSSELQHSLYVDLPIDAAQVYFVEEAYSSDKQLSVPGVKLVPTKIEHHTITPLATSSSPIQPPSKKNENTRGYPVLLDAADEEIEMQQKRSDRNTGDHFEQDDYDPYGDDDSVQSEETNDILDQHQPEVDDLESTWLDELFSNVSTCVCAPLQHCRMGSF